MDLLDLNGCALKLPRIEPLFQILLLGHSQFFLVSCPFIIFLFLLFHNCRVLSLPARLSRNPLYLSRMARLFLPLLLLLILVIQGVRHFVIFAGDLGNYFRIIGKNDGNIRNVNRVGFAFRSFQSIHCNNHIEDHSRFNHLFVLCINH